MMQKKICMYGLLSAFLCCGPALAQQQQHTVEMIPFGDMDQWIDRQIKESGIIGGALKNVYAIENGWFAMGYFECYGACNGYY